LANTHFAEITAVINLDVTSTVGITMEKSMKANVQKLTHEDETLAAAKRERQQRTRALVESGARSQESMFFISPALAKSATVKHRVLSF
jgi:hypothetical protein